MSDTMYVHYGSNAFAIENFTPVRNGIFGTKPQGGLWASRVDCEFGWKDWCELEQFAAADLSKSFKFKLSDSANIIQLRCLDDLQQLPTVENASSLLRPSYNYEEMLQSEIDAIELVRTGPFYYWLFDWDCQSIVVMNPDVVIPI